jgi:hypothetical protein
VRAHSILKYAGCSEETFILALIYMDQVVQFNPDFVISSLNVRDRQWQSSPRRLRGAEVVERGGGEEAGPNMGRAGPPPFAPAPSSSSPFPSALPCATPVTPLPLTRAKRPP